MPKRLATLACCVFFPASLGRWGRQVSPVPVVGFVAFVVNTLILNRAVCREAHKRWVSFFFRFSSTRHKNIQTVLVVVDGNSCCNRDDLSSGDTEWWDRFEKAGYQPVGVAAGNATLAMVR